MEEGCEIGERRKGEAGRFAGSDQDLISVSHFAFTRTAMKIERRPEATAAPEWDANVFFLLLLSGGAALRRKCQHAFPFDGVCC